MRAAIETITTQSRDGQGVVLTEGRLFFPSGIEAISLRFKIGTAVDIHVQISGRTLLRSMSQTSDFGRAMPRAQIRQI
jgi:hypothetical protein